MRAERTRFSFDAERKLAYQRELYKSAGTKYVKQAVVREGKIDLI